MTTSWRKILATTARLLVIATMALMIAIGQGTAPAYAKNLKKSGVSITNKKSLSFTNKYWYSGAGRQKMAVKISNVKTKPAAEEGYLTTTFKITFTRKWTPNKAQVNKMGAAAGKNGGTIPTGSFYYLIVDYNTGENLENEAIAEKYGVTIDHGEWKHTGTKTYNGTGGAWVSLAKKTTVTTSVTYPKSYKGLCIGAGTGQVNYSKSGKRQMEKFTNGKITYQRSWWHKKNKASTKFIRVK